MNRNIFAVALLAMATASIPAHAQVSALFGKKPAAPATGAPAPTGDALVDSFGQAQGHVFSAQHSLAEALGLKDQLALLQAEQKAMASGQVDLDAMKKRRTLADSVQAAIDARMVEQPELGAGSRAKFTEGLVSYIKAAVSSRAIVMQAQAYGQSIGLNPMALLGKARGAAYVVKEAPGFVKGMTGTTKALLAYAKRNKIEVPKNATAALDGL